jgi:hypothetical protein
MAKRMEQVLSNYQMVIFTTASGYKALKMVEEFT